MLRELSAEQPLQRRRDEVSMDRLAEVHVDAGFAPARLELARRRRSWKRRCKLRGAFIHGLAIRSRLDARARARLETHAVLLERKREREGAAAALDALQRQAPVHQLRELIRDRQA